MKTVTVFIPGRYEDAFLYMGRLVAVTDKRTLRAISLEAIVNRISDALPNAHPIPEFLFLRNDWLSSSMFKSMMKNEAIREAFVNTLVEFPSPFEVDLATIPDEEMELGVKAGHILDLNIYNGRVYLASADGVHDWDFDWKGDELIPKSDLRTRVGARCQSILTGYGAVNASCGENGLFIGFDEFGWRDDQPADELEQVQPRSLRTSWVGWDLINYAARNSLTLLHTKTESVEAEGYDREKRLFTSIADSDVDIGSELSGHLAEHDVDVASVQFIHNTSGTMFVSTYDHRFFAQGLQVTDEGDAKFTYFKEYDPLPGRILAATSTQLGIVAETDSDVLLLHGGGWETVANVSAISVRGFARSRRYKNLVVIVAEEGIHLVGIFRY